MEILLRVVAVFLSHYAPVLFVPAFVIPVLALVNPSLVNNIIRKFVNLTMNLSILLLVFVVLLVPVVSMLTILLVPWVGELPLPSLMSPVPGASGAVIILMPDM